MASGRPVGPTRPGGGRQISVDDPDKGITTSTYDDADRLVSTKDARGQSLFYDYDVLDRKTAVHNGSATGPVLASWAYDTLGKGLLTSSTRIVDGNSYVSAITGYDELNRPTGTQVTIPASEGKVAGVYSSSTEYNADGSVHEVKMPSVPGLPPEAVQTIYDAAGNLQAVGGWSAYVVGAQYSSLRRANALHHGRRHQQQGVLPVILLPGRHPAAVVNDSRPSKSGEVR
jgi:YD repeat-containing protein